MCQKICKEVLRKVQASEKEVLRMWKGSVREALGSVEEVSREGKRNVKELMRKFLNRALKWREVIAILEKMWLSEWVSELVVSREDIASKET